MKFYDFSDNEYYALIGAESEEEAIKLYEETVSDIEPDTTPPTEITEDEARSKLLNACTESFIGLPYHSKSGMEMIIQEEQTKL